VKVTVVREQKFKSVVEYLEDQKNSKKEPFKAVVVTECPIGKSSEVQDVSKFCRHENIPLIISHVNAFAARILTDFGEEFKVIEKNSEEISDVMIHEITKSTDEEGIAIVKLIEGFKHQF